MRIIIVDLRSELRTDVSTGTERIRLELELNPGATEPSRLGLSFSPQELFALFETLETVQAKIDQLCS